MQIYMDSRLRIIHKRKGQFEAFANEHFESEEVEWFPIRDLDGEDIDCRATLVRSFEVLEVPPEYPQPESVVEPEKQA